MLVLRSVHRVTYKPNDTVVRFASGIAVRVHSLRLALLSSFLLVCDGELTRLQQPKAASVPNADNTPAT